MRIDVTSPMAAGKDEVLQQGLRARKKIATRRSLQRAALDLVARRGLELVTVEDIAAAVDVSPRTFFNYFPSKEDALVGGDPEVPVRLARQLVNRPPTESPLAALRAVVVPYAEVDANEVDLLMLRMDVVEANPSLAPGMIGSFAEAERMLAQALSERTGRDVDDDAYPSLVAAVVVGALRASLNRWRAGAFTVSLAGLIDEAFGCLAAGLPAPSTDRTRGATVSARRRATTPPSTPPGVRT